jgi:hypothetical protein
VGKDNYGWGTGYGLEFKDTVGVGAFTSSQPDARSTALATLNDVRAVGVVLGSTTLNTYSTGGAPVITHTTDVGIQDSTSYYYQVGGADTNSNWSFRGSIGEIIHVNRAVTALERQAVFDYLDAKWNTAALPPPPPTLSLENFNGSSIDSSIWSACLGAGTCSVSGGQLTLTNSQISTVNNFDFRDRILTMRISSASDWSWGCGSMVSVMPSGAYFSIGMRDNIGAGQGLNYNLYNGGVPYSNDINNVNTTVFPIIWRMQHVSASNTMFWSISIDNGLSYSLVDSFSSSSYNFGSVSVRLYSGCWAGSTNPSFTIDWIRVD